MARCPGWPRGSCETWIQLDRELCGFCRKTRDLARADREMIGQPDDWGPPTARNDDAVKRRDV